jgi:peptidylprolyl isomerase
VRVPARATRPAARRFTALAGLLLVAAACGAAPAEVRSAAGTVRGLTVTGPVGGMPDVRMKAPLEVTATHVETLVEGDGAPVQADQLFVLQLTMYDARTGEKAVSTHDPGQTAMAVKTSDDSLFPVLSQALLGRHQGSRVLLVVTGDDAYGDLGAPQYHIEPGDPVVLVADVVAVPPTDVLSSADGTPVAPRPGLPRLQLDGSQPARLDFRRPNGRPLSRPSRLTVATLLRGTGPTTRPDSLVTIDYLGQVWGSETPFEDTYAKEPTTVPLGVGQVVAGWDQALVGIPRGSRLLVVVPPDLGFGAAGSPPSIPGGATLAYVIDVLGVS